MAELSPQLIERLTEAIELLVDKIGPSAQRLQKSLDDASAAAKKQSKLSYDLSRDLDSLAKNSKNLNEQKKAEQRAGKTLREETEKLYKQYREQSIGQKELNEGLISLRRTIKSNDSITVEAKARLLEMADGYRMSAKFTSIATENINKFGSAAGKVGSSLTGFISAYQSGGDAIGVASGMTKHGLTLAASAGERAGNVIGRVGGAMSQIPGWVGALGGLVSALGAGVTAVSGMSKEVIEKAFPILDSETRKLIGAFQSASQAGAVFGDGVDGLLNASAAAGLGVDKFAKVLGEQSSNIAMSGMGMQEGARMLGRIGESMRKSGVTQGLLQLGYSVEEITALNAQTMAQMRAGGGGSVDEAEVAKYTQQYAKDLKVLSSLTGEDVRAKDKEAKQRANTLAFNQKLAEMEPSQRTAILDSLKGMTAIEQQAFRERMANNGQLISQETNMYESMVQGAADKGKATFEAAMRGELTLGKVNDLNAQFAEQIGNSIRNAKEIGLAAEAGVEVVANLAKNMNESLQRSLMITPEALQKTTEEVNKAMTAAVGDTTVALGKVVLRTNELEAEMNRLVGQSGALRMFGDLISESARVMSEMIREVSGQNTAARQAAARAEEQRQNAGVGEAARAGRTLERGGFLSSMMGTSGTMQAEQRRLLGMTSEQLSQMAQEQGSNVDDVLKAVGITGGMAEFKKLRSLIYQTEEYARGGIADMPDTGGLAMLHGREAVIPLPEGLTPESLEKIVQRGATADSAVSSQQVQFSEMTDLLRILNQSMSDLLSTTRSVADHTERTARGVA
jgi:hypothetical protein